MNRRFTAWVPLALVMLHVAVSYSQGTGYKWGIGINAGAQKVYGDRQSVQFAPAFEGLFNYPILSFADLSFALGYSQLRYNWVPGVSNTTNIINADIKANFDLITDSAIRPFVGIGFGIANFNVGRSARSRFSDAVFISGGGFKIKVARRLDWILGADYRFTTGDAFDNPLLNGEGNSNDGFLNIRAGINYNIPNEEEESWDVIAEQRAPLYEVNNEPAADAEKFAANGDEEDLEMENMEEYVQLKSKADALSKNVQVQDAEINDLRKQVADRKQQIASMEQDVETQGPVPLKKNSSMSGFSEIYKEALTNYYNKSYSEAITLFELLLQQYPDHALASNCQFWVGQSMFAMARYQDSIDAFYKVLSYDRSLKKDDSLFFLGRAYLKTGAGDQAKESFSRLVRNYPASEYLAEAREYIQKL